MVLQKEGVKDLPWVLRVSNKQSKALDVSFFPSFLENGREKR